jgi:hypothetical protein
MTMTSVRQAPSCCTGRRSTPAVTDRLAKVWRLDRPFIRAVLVASQGEGADEGPILKEAGLSRGASS